MGFLFNHILKNVCTCHEYSHSVVQEWMNTSFCYLPWNPLYVPLGCRNNVVFTLHRVLPHCTSVRLISRKIKKMNSLLPNVAISNNTKRPKYFFLKKQFFCKPRDSGSHKRWRWGMGHRSSFRSGDVRDSQKITSKPDYVLLLSDKKVKLHGHRHYLLVIHVRL